jgi:hypothetical protein
MGKKKLTPNVMPNTLESMIEYTLILMCILDRICEMTKKPLEYPFCSPFFDLKKKYLILKEKK